MLKLATDKSGWGKAAPAGRSRGVAVMEGYGTYIALVAEVSIAENEIKVHKVTVAADLGSMVNPNIVRQQIESSVIFGMSAALFGEITMKDGVVEQSNFHDYPVVRDERVAGDRHARSSPTARSRVASASRSLR